MTGGLVRTQYWNVGGPNPTPRTGMTSRAESRTDVEGYLLVADTARNAALHGWGVVAGWQVAGATGQPGVTVATGVGLDITGRIVVLSEGGVAIVDPQVGPSGVQNIPTVPVAASGVVFDTAGLTGQLLVTIAWREVEDVVEGLLVLRHAPWLRLVDAATFSEDGVQLVLAAVELDGAGAVQGLTAGSRRLVAVTGSRLHLQRPVATGGLAGQENRAAIELTASGGLSVSNGSDSGGTLALLPAGGAVGIGLGDAAPRQSLHVEGAGIHSGGTGGGLSFADRAVGGFVADPTGGERWVWYAAGGAARLWSGADQLTVEPRAIGLRLAAGPAATTMELTGQGGPLGKLSIDAAAVTAHRPDGTESIALDTTNARVGVGTAAPSHAVHVTANPGIRQNRLYLGGNTGWSSLSYNAFHTDDNVNWVFPDPSRAAVTVEMDDADGVPRFQVYNTTAQNPQGWIMRLGIDGNSGLVTVPAGLNVGAGLSVGAAATFGAGASIRGVVSINTTTPNSSLVGSLNSTASNGTAICAVSQEGTAISASGNGGPGVWASGAPAAQFVGDVSVSGTLTAHLKQFVIDHPLDPANRLLAHAGVESSEALVIYSGTVACDEQGTAEVVLPDWLEALAIDFRYQLTCVGGYAPVYVGAPVHDNRFEIAGGSPGLEVSWELTGVRHDPWAQAHDLVVEQDKPAGERGFYEHPEAFGRDMTASVHYARNADLVKAHPILARQAVRQHAEREAQRVQRQDARPAATE